MNFIQRNPSDPKHQEFHDGEYEYWPAEDSIKTKSIGISAALVSGLELLAAAAAAGLLAVALSVLYVMSSPLAISENSAVINVNIYNDHDAQGVVYTLSTPEAPDTVLRDGTLENEEQTISLSDLNGGTAYLLKYYDSQQNEVGQFRFTTPGEKPAPEVPKPPAPAQPPEDSSGGMEEPVSEPENDGEDTDSTTESTAETVAPNEKPPVTVRPRPAPRPDPEEEEVYIPNPAPVPEPAPEVVPTPEPVPAPEPDPGLTTIKGLSYGSYASGNLTYGDIGFTEDFVFINVPDANYDVQIVQNGERYTGDFKEEYRNGTLTISVDGVMYFGERITTTVTIYTSAGTASKESVIAAPQLSSADVRVEANSDGTYTFTVTAKVAMKDGTAVIDKMNLTALLTPYRHMDSGKIPNAEELPLEPVPGKLSEYTSKPYTTSVPEGYIKNASVAVSGHWYRIDEHTYPQNTTKSIEYN
ncbi:MAG: hypothetical protein J6J12_02265 [Oscillospiraceae bacterium]|nr:hypothetical protein [Oscillospiraceae bacterium]